MGQDQFSYRSKHATTYVILKNIQIDVPIAREKQLKKRQRKWKVNLFKKGDPEAKDWAGDWLDCTRNYG
jgi:predicted GIY-YIG superfamily endonuclease